MIPNNIRKNKMALLFAVIITVVGLSILNLYRQFDFAGFVIGFGSSLSAVFAIRLFRNLNHPEQIEQEQIENADERNQMIIGKAGYANFRVVTILIAMQLVIYYFLRMQIPLMITFVVLVLNELSFVILRNRYEKKM